MDVLSVEEAWAVAKGIVGNTELIGSSTSYYGSVAQLMQANGWTAVTKGSEVLYYTRPAQIAIESGVKAYTEVASVSNVVTAESGAVTSATAATTGIGVSVAESAIAGAAAACFGYNIGNKIYDVNPEFWDGLMKDINEWTVENVPEGGVNAIVTVLEGVDTVLTLPSGLLDRISNYMIDSGIEDSGFIANVPTESGTYSFDNMGWNYDLAVNALRTLIAKSNNGNTKTNLNFLLSNLSSFYTNCYNKYHESYPCMTVEIDVRSSSGSISIGGVNPSNSYIISANSIRTDSLGNKYVNLSYPGSRYYDTMTTSGDYRLNNSTNSESFALGFNYSIYSDVCACSTSSLAMSFKAGVDGVNQQEDATHPSLNTPISDTYPDWWKNVIPISNGENGIIDYIPVSITDKDVKNLGDDQTQQQAQSGTNTNPKDNTNIKVKEDNDSGNNDKNTNPDSTDTGDTPILSPSTSIFGIAGVYNPTLEQIKSFTSWLWSENPITQLQQMFSNPMNAIIGLHLIYATPSTSAEKSIGVGYLDSGVLSKVVSEQYVTIDCGSVTIPSYYNNVNDWNPYTKISCYLPFIGIVKLNTDDLMSSNGNISQLNITYKVDVLTGACLAMLKVKRGSSDAILYQYNGSCSVQLPLTSGNYGGIIASLITTGVGIVSGVTPLAIGGAMSLTHPKSEIQRSGQLGANVGAMGIKKPYLIIERPYSKYASSYAKHIGYPSNNTIKLSSCHGFTRVKSTDVNNINTTEEERKMILNLLTSGIYI